MKNGKTALITGASSGIGQELASIFAEKEYDLVLVARNRERLSSQASALRKSGVKVRVIPKDLSLPQAPGEIFKELRRDSIKVEVLVNAAGFGVLGPFAETSLEEELKMIQLNITALTSLTKLFLKEMIENRSGRILNVASTAAFQPGPMMAVYYASKAYVLSFSEAIALEARGTGVTVTCLCPGPTDTNFHERAKSERSNLVNGKVLRVMTPRAVAEIGYNALMKNKSVVVPGVRNRLLALSVRFAPRDLVTRIAGQLHKNSSRSRNFKN